MTMLAHGGRYIGLGRPGTSRRMSNPKSAARRDGCMSGAVGGTLSSCRACAMSQIVWVPDQLSALPQPIPSRRTACAGDNRASRDRIELSSSVETSSSDAVSAIDIRFPVIHSRRISPGCVGCCVCIFMGLPYVPRSSCPSHASTDAERLLVPRRQSSGLKQEIDRFRQQRLNVAVLRHRKMAQLRRSAGVEVPADVFQAGAAGAGRSCSPGHIRCVDRSWRSPESNLSGRTL